MCGAELRAWTMISSLANFAESKSKYGGAVVLHSHACVMSLEGKRNASVIMNSGEVAKRPPDTVVSFY